MLLSSTHTGEPLAIFPDGVLQRMRVGAASALGAKYMARPDAAGVGLIGARWQAGAQAMAIAGLEDVMPTAPTLGEPVAGMPRGRSFAERTSCFLNLAGIGLRLAAAGAGRELPGEWLTEDVLPWEGGG